MHSIYVRNIVLSKLCQYIPEETKTITLFPIRIQHNGKVHFNCKGRMKKQKWGKHCVHILASCRAALSTGPIKKAVNSGKAKNYYINANSELMWNHNHTSKTSGVPPNITVPRKVHQKVSCGHSSQVPINILRKHGSNSNLYFVKD